MDWSFVRASAIMLVLNLTYALAALFLGVIAMRVLDKLILTKIDLEEEIKKGNVAAAIFAAAILLLIALIIGPALAK